jgi:hypothetical protein
MPAPPLRATAANEVRSCIALLDHLIGAQQEHLGDRQAERFGGLQVDG